jgi:hypothetical protein
MGMFCKGWDKGAIQASVVALLCAVGGAAQAQISRNFIGPHEYALPDPKGMKTWDVFVQYSFWQNNLQAWNSNGDRVAVNPTSQGLTGLSKWVHFWTPETLGGNVGLGWELIPIEAGVRGKGGSTGGFADPITGPALWIKPAPNWTLGWDFFAQIPIGDKDVGGGDRWNNISSIFWDGQFGKLNYSADLGYVWSGASGSGGPRGGLDVFTNHRLGYSVTDLLEPYIGIDYETQSTGSDSKLTPSNHEVAGAIGVMFHTFAKSTLTVHYERGFSGENRPVSNNIDTRFVWVF